MELTIPTNEITQIIDRIVDERLSTTTRDDRWLNKTNAAEYLDVSRPTLNKWIKKYQIPYSMIDGIRRYSKDDLDKFMEEHKR